MRKLGVKHWVKAELGGQICPVILGDTVWYHQSNDPVLMTDRTPQCGVITLIGEDNMVDLVILADQPGVHGVGRMVKRGVPLYGDPRLAEPGYKGKGCWLPRWRPDQVMATPAEQVEG